MFVWRSIANICSSIAKRSTQFTLPLLHIQTPRQGIFSLISAFLNSLVPLKNVLKNQNRNAFIALHTHSCSSFSPDIVIIQRCIYLCKRAQNGAVSCIGIMHFSYHRPATFSTLFMTYVSSEVFDLCYSMLVS